MAFPLHVSTEAHPSDRGRMFGRAQAGAVRNTVETYLRLFHELLDIGPSDVAVAGIRVGERLAAFDVELADEVEGIASGAQVDHATLLALNARTELLAAAGDSECSTIALPPSGALSSTLLAQNWDWHPALGPSTVLWRIATAGGRWILTLTEAGLVGKIGINSSGVALCLNILWSSADGGIDGVPIHIAARSVLDRCDSLEEASRLLGGLTVSASSCFTVADPSGAAMVELSPAGATVIPVTAPAAHTNHFLRLPDGLEDYMLADSPNSESRLAEVDEALHSGMSRSVDAVSSLLSSHEGAPYSICCHDELLEPYAQRRVTLATVVMDTGSRRMFVTDGPPCVRSLRLAG